MSKTCKSIHMFQIKINQQILSLLYISSHEAHMELYEIFKNGHVIL